MWWFGDSGGGDKRIEVWCWWCWNNKNELVGVMVVEERKQCKCGDGGCGSGNNWIVDENGGLGLAGFYFYYFLFKTTTNAFLLFSVFCNNLSCFHSSTTFLFILSLYRQSPSPPPPPHSYCFPFATTTTTTFQLFYDITLWHHIDNTKMLRKNLSLKKGRKITPSV